jgi:hypothetical protein
MKLSDRKKMLCEHSCAFRGDSANLRKKVLKSGSYLGEHTDWQRRAKGQPMSLQVCPDCQHLTDTGAYTCAHCGRRFRETGRQRFVRIAIRTMLVVVVVSALIGGALFLIQQGNASPAG